MKKYFFILFLFAISSAFAQFGQNKVQYKNFEWYYIQTEHFDIYFTKQGSMLAEFTAKAAEEALSSIQNSFKYRINNRITFIVYNSTNDFQETNVTDQYLTEGIEGFTELFKNRVVIQFMGSYKELRHLIHHELTHAVMNDMFFGGSIQNVITNNININLPLWFSEGMAEYQSLGWDVNTDMYIRDAAISEYLPDIPQLDGYFAYRGGQSVFYYISQKYGKEKIGELINKVKGNGNLEQGLKESIGLNLEELNERWKKDIKQKYWPDIAIRQEPAEFSKQLTDHRKDGGFYNTSPALSPQGDKIAFITNRNIFFDVYLMSAIDGKIIKKLIEGNRTNDFEQLNILTPGLSWSPDGRKIALSAKSGGWDVIYIIDVESEDREELTNLRLDEIKNVQWSPDGEKILFVGHTASQSDVYVYDLTKKEMINLTNDIFSDNFASWSPDGNTIYFTSDRLDNLESYSLPDSFKIYNHNYTQDDIYSMNLLTNKLTRITDLPLSNESSPVVGPNGDEILFISDLNGISNIYKKKIGNNDSINPSTDPIPVTNSLNGLYQLSISKDGKKLAFSSLHQAAYNIFLMNNPFEASLDTNKLKPTLYISKLLSLKNNQTEEKAKVDTTVTNSTNKDSSSIFYTGNIVDTTNVYGDSIKIDFNNYVFGNNIKVTPDSTINENFKLSDNLDKNGNYRVNKYKITFSPDIVYANAGYSTLYGLLGTTVLSFSDVLGNHRLIGQTSLQIDLKNSDYGLAYYYLPNRLDIGIEGFHTARFVYLRSLDGEDLYRFRNYGLVFSLSYPLNRFYRFDGALSYLNLSQENLENSAVANQKVNYLIPNLSFIHDNILWGYTAPIEGVRYRLDAFGNPGIGNSKLSFYSLLGDYRKYFRFWYDYSFAFRLAGGYSGGNNPQRFFIGGIENWINRRFSTGDIPLNSPSDYAFLTAAL
ncbi:MAG: peptidase MA family metallohydrolase, partial [Syntrophothermus sp.]